MDAKWLEDAPVLMATLGKAMGGASGGFTTGRKEVVDLLQGQESAAFAAAFRELLGDAYYALGRIEDAQIAYQEALLDPLSEGTVDQQREGTRVQRQFPDDRRGARGGRGYRSRRRRDR